MNRSELPTPEFARANGITGMHRSGGTLFVDAARELSPEALRALEFVAGGDLVVTVSPAIPSEPGPIADRLPSFVSPPSAQVAEPVGPARRSLAERLLEPLTGASDMQDSLRRVALLIDAGHSARSLGLNAGRREVSVARLSEHDPSPGIGMSLAEWAESLPSMPAWIRSCLSSCHDESRQALALKAIVALGERQSRWRQDVTAAAARSLFLWPALVALWIALSWPLALVIAAVGAAFAFRFAQLRGTAADADAVRAEILRVVAIQCRMGLPPGNAVRIGAFRLKEIEPTWGEAPETREGLAGMLRLDRADRLILMTGALEVSALRLARECERRAKAALVRTSIAANVALGLLAATTVVGLLA